MSARASNSAQRCYICDQNIHGIGTDIFVACTENTKTAIHELLEQFIGHSLSRWSPDQNWSCSDCLNRINDYDLACYTAHQVQKELTELLSATDEKYCKNDLDVVSRVADEVAEEDDEAADNSEIEDDFDNSKEVLVNTLEEIIEDAGVLECEEDYEEPIPTKERHLGKIGKSSSVAIKDEMLDMETDEYELRFFSAADNFAYEDMYESEDDGKKIICKVYSTPVFDQEDNADSKLQFPMLAISPDGQRQPPNYCLQCERNFESKEDLREHRRTIHKKPPKIHKCEICHATYKLRNALRVHMLLHNGDSPFQCDVCGKKFTQKGALKRHMPIHTGECRYQCEKCGKQFIHYSSFHMHNLAHDDVRKKKCDVCGLLLRSNSHLKRHLQVHTGAKPHKCPKCDKTFAQRYNMMTHLRSHQGLPRKRKHTCPVCERVFTKETSLQDHLNTGVCRSEDNAILELYNSIATADS